MRLVLAATLIAGGLLVACVSSSGFAVADPETCPPVCDKIPDTAWISSSAIPLNATYHWPSPAGSAVPMTGGATPRFRFEEVCATPVFPQDTRNSAVASRVAVDKPQGEWQLRAEVVHWRGDTARGGQSAASVCLRRVAVGHRRRAEPAVRGSQRAGDHAYLPGRAPGKQHDQPADPVGVRPCPAALADHLRRPGAGRHGLVAVRGLPWLVLAVLPRQVG